MKPDSEEERALEALKAEYDGTGLSEAARRRIARGVFTGRRPKRASLKVAVAFGLAAVIAVIAAFVAVSVWTNRPIAGMRGAAVVRELRGRVRVSSPSLARGDAEATAGMRLEASSAVDTVAGARAVLSVGPHEIAVREDSRLELRRVAPGRFDIEVERGGARFHVAHLGEKELFTVTADGLRVEVVGTVFEVTIDGDCPSVAVEEGRVRASFDGAVGFVAAGETRRYCRASVDETAILAPVETEPSAFSPSSSSSPSTPSISSTPSTFSSPSSPPPPPIPAEERLYREALDSRVRGDLTLASAQMADYLEQYPSGAFAEEALFSLVRLGYRRRNLDEVALRGGDYLARYPSRSAKTDEVRILLAESLHRRGSESEAFAALAPIVGDIDSVAGPYREQALELCFASAASTGRATEAQRCAAQYLDRYPEGAGAPAARATAKRP